MQAPPPPPTHAEPTAPPRGAVSPERNDEGTARRREISRFRGLNLGAAFFGWLVGVGMAAILTAMLSAAGAALALTKDALANTHTTTTLTLTGATLLAVILLLSYYAGGYVAGRLSRFSGAVQGVGVWVIGLVVTVGLAIAAAAAGTKYNVLGQLRLPSIPVSGQSFAPGGAIVLAAVAVLTLVAAMLGGVVGLRYHHRVDRALRRS